MTIKRNFMINEDTDRQIVEQAKRDIVEEETKLVMQVVRDRRMVKLGVREFFDRFFVKIEERHGSTCFGGIENNRPFISISLHGYHWDTDYDDLIKNLKISINTLNSVSIRLVQSFDRGERMFVEYDDFCYDPDIGDYIVENERELIRCIAAHEMAHVLQYWNVEPDYDEEDVHDRHNDVWKRDYRILRKALGLVRK